FSLSSAFLFQAEDGIRDFHVTGVQTCALPILVDRLPVGHALGAGTVADTVGALGAALDETYLEAAVRNLRLAEAVTEQIGGNADVLLAHAYRQLVITGLDQAGFGEHIHAQAGKQQEGGKTHDSRSDRGRPTLMPA